MILGRCDACACQHWVRHKHCDVTMCFMCGSWHEANALLRAYKIAPREILQLLSGQQSFNGITLEIARSCIEVFRARHDKPN